MIKKHATSQNPEERTCNCNGGITNCPLQGQCLQKGLIYKASINSGTEEKTYIGQAGNTFKERFANHKSTFKSKKYENSTALSKYIWKMKENKTEFKLKWSKLASASSYQPSTRKCNLCNVEKTMILYSTDTNLLNKRSELMNKCRHRNKFLLQAVT